MPEGNRYDAIVVGAGPAGSVAAYRLARAGCRMLLLEREALPRYKPCGGAVVWRALEALPFSLNGQPVIERWVSRFYLTLDLDRPLLVERARPALAMTMRSKLDELLARKAAEAGAVLKEKVIVKSVSELDGSVRCETSAGSFVGQYLIGADGANSVVARNVPLFGAPQYGVALEAEIYAKTDALLYPYSNRVDFDFHALPGGYGWVFPKADHLSVGVFTLKTSFPPIRHWLGRYMERKGFAAEAARIEVCGHRIPLGPSRDCFHSQRILLAGDAAGLVDPLTGEGISYAIRSGLWAAQAVAQKLLSPKESLDSYSEQVRTSLLPEILAGARLASVFYRCPTLSYRLLARKPLFAQRLADVFEGKTTYQALLRKLLRKPYKFL